MHTDRTGVGEIVHSEKELHSYTLSGKYVLIIDLLSGIDTSLVTTLQRYSLRGNGHHMVGSILNIYLHDHCHGGINHQVVQLMLMPAIVFSH